MLSAVWARQVPAHTGDRGHGGRTGYTPSVKYWRNSTSISRFCSPRFFAPSPPSCRPAYSLSACAITVFGARSVAPVKSIPTAAPACFNRCPTRGLDALSGALGVPASGSSGRSRKGSQRTLTTKCSRTEAIAASRLRLPTWSHRSGRAVDVKRGSAAHRASDTGTTQEYQ